MLLLLLLLFSWLLFQSSTPYQRQEESLPRTLEEYSQGGDTATDINVRSWTSLTDSCSQHVTLVHSLTFPGFRHGSRNLVTRLLPRNVGIKQSDAEPWRGPRQPWSSGLAPVSRFRFSVPLFPLVPVHTRPSRLRGR